MCVHVYVRKHHKCRYFVLFIYNVHFLWLWLSTMYSIIIHDRSYFSQQMEILSVEFWTWPTNPVAIIAPALSLPSAVVCYSQVVEPFTKIRLLDRYATTHLLYGSTLPWRCGKVCTKYIHSTCIVFGGY